MPRLMHLTLVDNGVNSTVWCGVVATPGNPRNATRKIGDVTCVDCLTRVGIIRVVGESATSDAVNHPKHYNSDPSGIECIQVVRHRTFNVGNAIKYLWRAGLKKSEDAPAEDNSKQIEDLKKAIWYIQDEIKLLSGEFDAGHAEDPRVALATDELLDLRARMDGPGIWQAEYDEYVKEQNKANLPVDTLQVFMSTHAIKGGPKWGTRVRGVN